MITGFRDYSAFFEHQSDRSRLRLKEFP